MRPLEQHRIPRLRDTQPLRTGHDPHPTQVQPQQLALQLQCKIGTLRAVLAIPPLPDLDRPTD